MTGPEFTDVAHQAADDAMLAILAKLAGFRGESRFMTWAYRFVILEVPGKLGRHYWHNPLVTLDAGQWERLPDRLGIDPLLHAESAAVLAEVRRVDDELTVHQRRVFVAIVVDGIPLDGLAARLGLQRNTVYEVIFDARRKIRSALVAKGHPPIIAAPPDAWASSWTPMAGTRRPGARTHRVTPGRYSARSSPSTSRTPTFALPATAPSVVLPTPWSQAAASWAT